MQRMLLSLLATACIAAAPAHAATPAPLAPRALIDSVAARYATLPAFHVAGTVAITARADSLAQPYQLDVTFELARAEHGRARAALQSAQMSSLLVCDGDSVWTALPASAQFTVQAAPRSASGAVELAALSQSMAVAEQYASLASGVTGVADLGTDTVETAAGALACRRLSLSAAADGAQPGSQRARVVWIDEARRIVWRDSVHSVSRQPGAGRIVSDQSVRFVQSDDASGRDSLFRFHAPPGWQRVEQFAPPPPPQAAMIGKPAIPFTLAGLDGKRVSLDAQRGKVVVLDFWATWCGPCRRWMPIVAAMNKQLAGRDVRFWAINVGEGAAKVKAFLAQNPEVVPILLDSDSKVGGQYGATSIPLTVVIGRDGKVAQVLLGLHPEEDLRAALRTAGVKGL